MGESLWRHIGVPLPWGCWHERPSTNQAYLQERRRLSKIAHKYLKLTN